MVVYALFVLVIVFSVALVFSQHNANEWKKLYEKEKELYEKQYQRAERILALYTKTINWETGMQNRIEFSCTSKDEKEDKI